MSYLTNLILATALILTFLLWVGAGLPIKNQTEKEYVVVCYVSEWSFRRRGLGRFTIRPEISHLCTHIIFAFGKLPNNQLTSTGTQRILELTALKKINPDLKVMIAVGGGASGSENFISTVTKRSSRDEFLRSAIAFLKKHELDGLDLDWEYPTGQYVKLFTAWCQELRAGFEQEANDTGTQRLLLTAAVRAGSQAHLHYEIKPVVKDLDYIFLMSYDFHGSWDQKTGFNTPLPEVKRSVQDWLKRGTPAKKLVVGMAAYGRSFKLATPNTPPQVGEWALEAGMPGPYTGEAGILAYYEICDRIRSGWTIKWDENASVPFAYGEQQWVGFDNPCSIERKIELIKSLGLAGAMMWALGLDDFSDNCGEGTYPLTSIINDQLLRTIPVLSVDCNVTLIAAAYGTMAPSLTTKIAHCVKSGPFPNPDDCKTYFVCPPHHIRPITMPCLPGLHFNRVSLTCDYPEHANCTRFKGTEKTTHVSAPTSAMILTSKPQTNCSRYQYNLTLRAYVIFQLFLFCFYQWPLI